MDDEELFAGADEWTDDDLFAGAQDFVPTVGKGEMAKLPPESADLSPEELMRGRAEGAQRVGTRYELPEIVLEGSPTGEGGRSFVRDEPFRDVRLYQSPEDAGRGLQNLGDRINDTTQAEAHNVARGLNPMRQALGRAGAPLPPDITPVGGPAALGGGQTMGFGFMDELGGAVHAATPESMGGGTYQEGRDRVRAAETHAADTDPGAYVGGVGVGMLGLAAAPIPNLPVPAGAGALPTLARIGVAGAEGALYGGLGAAGSSTADLTGDSENALSEFGSDVGGGATAGGLTGSVVRGGGELAARGMNALRAQGASRMGDLYRLRSLGARTGDMRRLERSFPGGTAGAAQAARDAGFTGVYTVEQAAERLPAVEREALGGIQRALGIADGQPVVDTGQVTSELSRLLPEGFTPQTQSARASMQRTIDQISESAPDGLTMAQLQGLKREFARNAAFGGTTENISRDTASRAYNTVRTLMDDAVERHGQALGDPQAQQRYQAARRAWALAERAGGEDGWAAAQMAREGSNRLASPSDQGMAVAGGAAELLRSGRPVQAGLAAAGSFVANRLIRRREHAAIATGYERVAQMARQNPAALGPFGQQLQNAAQRGPGAFAAAYFALSHQSPEFRQAVESATEEPTETETEQP